MNSVVFNFSKGKLAQFIEERINRKIKRTNGGYFVPKTFSFQKIKVKGNYYYSEDGEDHYFVFAFLGSYFTKKYNSLPKFHIYTCESREKYQGYTFANRMPVDIYSRDEHKTIEQVNLSLCKDCRKEINHSLWGMFSNLDWYDVVLKKANEATFTIKDTKKDGYIKLWKQISEAYREKKHFICEECSVNLENDKFFLEVHHIDKNRLNNKEDNLKSLCVLCHSKKHPNNYNKGTNLFKINEFRKKYKG